MINGDTAPHSMEPQFRKLGLGNISLKKGTPTMSDAQTVCKEGEKLKPDQAHILKLFGVAMATVGHYCLSLSQFARWLTRCSSSDALAHSSRSYRRDAWTSKKGQSCTASQKQRTRSSASALSCLDVTTGLQACSVVAISVSPNVVAGSAHRSIDPVRSVLARLSSSNEKGMAVSDEGRCNLSRVKDEG